MHLPCCKVTDHHPVVCLGLERRQLAWRDLQAHVIGNPMVRLIADDARRGHDVAETSVVGNLVKHLGHWLAISLANGCRERVETESGLARKGLADEPLQRRHMAVAHHLRPLNVVINHVEPRVFLQEEMLFLVAHAVTHRAIVNRLRPGAGHSHAENHCHKPMLHFQDFFYVLSLFNPPRCRAYIPSCALPLPPRPMWPP